MSPRPTEAMIAEYYQHSKSYQYWAKYIFPASEDARREKVHRPSLNKTIEFSQHFAIIPETLLEIGLGFGTFANLAQSSS